MRMMIVASFLTVMGCAHERQQAAQPMPTAETEQAPAPEEQPAPVQTTAAAEKPQQQQAAACPMVRVHFAFDSAALEQEQKAPLDQAARCLRANQKQRVRIEGNADERGSDDYNKRLGAARAQAVASYLASQGVSRPQLDTVSFGEDNPLCQQSDTQCWARNRRTAVRASCRM